MTQKMLSAIAETLKNSLLEADTDNFVAQLTSSCYELAGLFEAEADSIEGGFNYDKFLNDCGLK